MKKPWVIAFTGASGVQYGVRLIQVLLQMKYPVHLIISEAARIVMREELGKTFLNYTRPKELEGLFECPALEGLEVFSPKDFTAPAASGSYPLEGMVVVPCSMGSLGAIANGLSQNLIHRAADCVIKEGRNLILVPRETPLSAIHLENMLKLARLGVRIVPAMPGFYSGAKEIHEIVDFMVGKILDQMDIVHALYPRWTGLTSSKERDAQEIL